MDGLERVEHRLLRWLRMPAEPDSNAKPTGMGPRPARTQGAVLFVDDEPDMLETLRLNFEATFDVLVAAGGTEALAVMEASPVAVLVVDQLMPGMTGIELIVAARQLHPRTIPIILSGYTDTATLLAALNTGDIYRFVTKPFETDDLELAIRGALEKATPGRDARAPRGGGSLFKQRARAERRIVERALERTQGNKSAAARELEITYRALVKIMRRLGMAVGTSA